MLRLDPLSTASAASFNRLHVEPELGASCVMKFGGTSVADAERMRHVADIIRAHTEQGPVGVVVSAVAGMTRLLADALRDALAGENAETAMDHFVSVHREIIDDLFCFRPEERESLTAFVIERSAERRVLLAQAQASGGCCDETYARILGLGEIVSSRIVHALLRAQGVDSAYVDALSFVQTTGSLKQGVPDVAETARRFAGLPPSPCLLMPGFIASDAQGRFSLLGWDGSDCSAAIMASAMGADACILFKHDVDGVYTANPHTNPGEAQFCARLTCAEAYGLAARGASVVHPNSIGILQQAGIPLWVRSTADLQKPGTLIADRLER